MVGNALEQSSEDQGKRRVKILNVSGLFPLSEEKGGNNSTYFTEERQGLKGVMHVNCSAQGIKYML